MKEDFAPALKLDLKLELSQAKAVINHEFGCYRKFDHIGIIAKINP